MLFWQHLKIFHLPIYAIIGFYQDCLDDWPKFNASSFCGHGAISALKCLWYFLIEFYTFHFSKVILGLFV